MLLLKFIWIHLLDGGTNAIRTVDAGPVAEIEKYPVVVGLYVVTTKMYVRAGCKSRMIRN
jgi:hypothetical protein